MNIGVFCGSQCGNNAIYRQTTVELGQLMVEQGHTLVYGGGSIGLMGILADEMLRLKGKVIGVIPEFFNMDAVGHKGISEMIFVKDMSERKTKMSTISDAFIALPGGLGTLDEFFEMAAFSQLHLHEKPVGLLNINNYYFHQIEQLKTFVHEGFLTEQHFNLLLFASSPVEMLEKIQKFSYHQDMIWVKKIKNKLETK